LSAAQPRTTAGERYRRLEGFVRDYTAGLDGAGVRRMLDRDRKDAWRVLERESGAGEEPKRGLRRWWHRAKVLFLGVSYRLSPPRRLLFALSLFAALLSLGERRFGIRIGDNVGAEVDASLFWSLFSICGLLYLLIVELVDRAQVRDELEVARSVQRDLLPAACPALPGWTVCHSIQTAAEVGGDAYDFVELPDGRLALVAADASGHGMAAGLVMAVAVATWRSAIESDPEPEAIAAAVHRALRRAGGRRGFLTLFYALLDPRAGELRWTCAGHPFPIVLRADGRVEELGDGALPLGLRESANPSFGTIRLDPGDLVVVYTDGLVETLGRDGGAFGHERLRSAIGAGGPAASVHDRIVEAFRVHLGDERLSDDLSLVVLRREPPVPPPPGA